MPAVGLDLLALGGAALAVAGTLEVGFATLIAFWLLVPATLLVPHAPHLVYVDRLVLYALVVRLVLRAGRRGEPPGSAYRLSAVHLALLAYLAVGLANGVVLAPADTSLASNLHSFLDQVDLVLLFVVSLAVLRTLGLRRVLHLVAVAVLATVAVAVAERLWLHGGWSHFFFEREPAQGAAPGSLELARRGGSVRVQVAAQFALEYGWVLAMLLPVVGIAALDWARRPRWAGRVRRWNRRALVLAPVAVVGGIVLTASRSAELGLLAGALVFVVASGLDRRVVLTLVGAGVLALLASLAVPALFGSPFSAAAHTNSVSLRVNRLPDVFAAVTGRPFEGVGFTGLRNALPGLDNAYALLYGTLGVPGLVAWIAVVLTALAAAVQALRAPRGSGTRLAGAAAGTGLVLGLGAAASYDAVVTYQSTWTLVILAAVGVVAAERATFERATVERATSERATGGRRHRRQRRHGRIGACLVVPLMATAAGFAVLTLTPTSSSQTLALYTISPWVLSDSEGYIDDYTGKVLSDTLCPQVTAPVAVLPGATVRCVRATDVVPLSWDGLVDVRVGAANPSAVRAAERRALAVSMPVTISATGPIETGRPAWATTAPLWMGSAGLLGALLWPTTPRRRRRAQPGAPGRRRSGRATRAASGDDHADARSIPVAPLGHEGDAAKPADPEPVPVDPVPEPIPVGGYPTGSLVGRVHR